MSKTKIWLVTATALVLSGVLLCVGVMMALKWDFLKLSTAHYERNNYEIQEDFHSISIIGDTSDITFIPTPDEMASVFCFEDAKAKHSISVENGTLIIEQTDKRNWYDNIGIIVHDPDIKVYLPQQKYDTLTVTESTGDIEISSGFSFETIDISLSTGDINLTDVNCNKLITAGNTGDVTLKNVIAAESFHITRTTGDVLLENCDAQTLKIETNTGDVTGSLLSNKIFIAETSTGDIDLPQSVSGGNCEITTTTGDIEITVN